MNFSSQVRKTELCLASGPYDTKAPKGTLIIPDISGFSTFVHNTDLDIGKKITLRLLSSIMNSNILNLDISEIEGDAILFYKYGKRFSMEDIFFQYEVMREKFNQELRVLSEELEGKIELSLKLITHYGPVAEYTIGGFKKLYGETVVEAHRLLKNSIDSNAYVLMTHDFIHSAVPSSPSGKIQALPGNKICDINGNLRNICFTFFDYQKSHQGRPLVEH